MLNNIKDDDEQDDIKDIENLPLTREITT